MHFVRILFFMLPTHISHILVFKPIFKSFTESIYPFRGQLMGQFLMHSTFYTLLTHLLFFIQHAQATGEHFPILHPPFCSAHTTFILAFGILFPLYPTNLYGYQFTFSCNIVLTRYLTLFSFFTLVSIQVLHILLSPK